MKRPNPVVGRLYPATTRGGVKFKAEFVHFNSSDLEYEFLIPSGFSGAGRRLFRWNGKVFVGIYLGYLTVFVQKKSIKGKKVRTGNYRLEKIS